MTPGLHRARFPEDTDTIRSLFLGYIDALCQAMPENRDAITQKYDPAAVEAWLTEFARIHVAPKGNLLIARAGGEALACAMLREFEPGIAEIQRLFVTPKARGTGLARKLSQALMDQARTDGFHTIRLDTARQLTGAIKLYKSMGFTQRPPYHNLTPQMDHFILYFERPL